MTEPSKSPFTMVGVADGEVCVDDVCEVQSARTTQAGANPEAAPATETASEALAVDGL